MENNTQFRIELDKLSQDLKARSGRKKRVSFRTMMWQLTVAFSYKLKRGIDLLASFFGLIILSPVFIILALAVKLTSPGPIIFSQVRVGRYGKHFRFYKFRSMYIDAEARKAQLMEQNELSGDKKFKMKNDPRITPVGRFIRKTSMDELPQLVNVLLGDMSLVGPRPPVPSETKDYTLEERKRLNVIPGITCIWQISGRSDIPFEQQVQLDKDYIRSQSIWFDLWILLKTIPAIFIGKGAY